MTNFLERSLLFILGLPLLLLLIIFTAPYGHIGWVAVVLLFAFLGTRESYLLFFTNTRESGRGYLLVAVLGALLLLAAYADARIEYFIPFLPLALTFDLFVIFLVTLLRWNVYTEQGSFLRHLVSGIAALIYPSLFAAFLVLVSSFENAHHLILLFLVLNFGNDTFAYLAGKFLARRDDNRTPLIAISPNKTLIGFIGGFIGSLLAGLLYLLAMPELLAGPLPAHLLFFFLIALFGNIGDLLESGIKRSAAIKDSGNLIPGRGGVLDSIDSLLFSAPVFYYSITIFFA
jgi:phosphatidate cytidylyltransferase